MIHRNVPSVFALILHKGSDKQSKTRIFVVSLKNHLATFILSIYYQTERKEG